MNHLPVPENRQRPSRRVLLFGYYDIPFLGQIAESNDNFYAYAEAHSLADRDEKYTPNLSRLQELEDADIYFARVQAWLYFGLIADTFGARTCAQDFIVTNPSSNGQIINSTKLKLYMSQWRVRVGKMRKEAKDERIQRVKNSTTAGWKFCDQLDHYGVPTTEVHMLIVFSIRILICSLWDMLWASDMGGAHLNDEFKISVDIVRWPHLPASYRPLAVLMVEYDWCFHEVLRLLDTYRLTTVWSITCLQGRDASQLDHGRCADASKCVARDVDPVNHQAQHLTRECTCEAIGPDVDEVSKILKTGGIPLVRCTVHDDGRVSLKVIPAKGSKRHIAFSHVWADGMVIPMQNKVFRCRFLKLASYLRRARPRVQAERLFYLPFAPFLARNVFKGPKSFDIWLDIFCIPSAVRPEFRELRKQAMARIYPVFAGAEAVLVVDKALTEVKNTDMSTTETMARVASSGWMTRCWTFSEASLAQQSIMLFCIGDRLIEYNDFQRYTKVFKKLDLPSRSLLSDLLRTAFYPFHIAWLASQPVVSEYVGFAFVWNALTARSTSWPDDAWGIMATLLGYSSKEIMNLPERDRLPAMMHDLPKVPASFFFRDLPRSASVPAHMRWIPTQIQGQIRDADGTFAFAEGGIVFPPSLKFKFILGVKGQLPHTFSFELAHEDWQRRQLPISFEVTIHDHGALTEHVRGTAQICILLPWTEGRSGDSETKYISGNGCCLLVRHIRPDSIVEADFLSSISYKFTQQKQQSHFQASTAGPIVVIPCNREQWYQPKTRRKRHSLPPWTTARILYFGVPAVLVFIMAATMIPLWVWYRTTGQSSHTRDILVFSTCGFALSIVAVQFAVIFHEKILIGNWIDSFEDREGPNPPWWRRIMPLF
ncbi:uncharacterized protein Z518_08619 [Rhinocladiella mackenziei CBS 650.93]|uniref:Heterokaryon incompatibility domain-containing protein n=1 Tax=Rhinocladiella mackenziei CBS 650.93 TaxID=1442369 RepID=A0A0D2FL42_9EURO|nr:uncharacterized protein Z518_08619 [Rhinocladiella mackenziei CBS 650.93]KIX02677.1 hypothetical protein Z518_08619 [Rhinocladiella mackenziei CBS 650.93]